MNESVQRVSDRAGVDPFFLAFALAEYAAVEEIDDAALAARLGTSATVLPHVRLCRAPRTDPDGLREDVSRIAARFRLNATVLKTIARHGEVVAAMRAAAEAASESAAFLAARDRASP